MIGKTISHYKILEKLGEGGMGVVYKAEDTRLDRHVAIKFLPSQLKSDKDAKKRFIHEAKATSALNHSNIAVVHEINETHDGQMFIVMAYYDGHTLKDKLEGGALNVDEAVAVASQIASALGTAHEKGILHRDIKPANILLGVDGQAKLADFGLAKLAGQTKVTKTGTTVGTVAYMSPEQASGGHVDHRSDIFSLGVVLYELLTGELPFRGDHEAAVLYGIINSDPKPLVTHRVDLPQGLQRIVETALCKDASSRYQTASDMLADLKAIKAGGATTASDIRRRRKSTVRTVLLFTVLTIVIAGGYAGYQRFKESREPVRMAGEENRFVIAVAPFWGQNAEAVEEGKVMQALVERRLVEELGEDKTVAVLGKKQVVLAPQSHEDAKALGEGVGATIVLWGEVLVLRGEVEVQPYLTLVEWVPNFFEDYSTGSMQAKTEGSNQLSLRKAKAKDVGQVALRVAGAFYSKKNPDKALAILQRIIPPTVESLMDQGMILAARYEWDESEKLIQQAIDLAPDEARPYYGMAVFYMIQRNCLGAIPWYQKAIEVDSTFRPAHIGIGFCLTVMGKFDEATRWCEKTLVLFPGDFWAIMNMSSLENYQERYDNAKESCEKAIDVARNPSELARAYLLMGDIHRREGENDEGQRWYEKSIEHDPENWMPYYSIGSINYEKQAYEEAIKWYERGVRLPPNRVPAELPASYMILGRYPEAAETIRRFMDIYPGDNFRVWYITCLLQMGEKEKANEQAAAWAKTLDDDAWSAPVIRFYAGEITEGEVLKAAEVGGAKKDNEQKCEAYYHLGMAHLFGFPDGVESNTTSAKKYFENCVSTSMEGLVEFKLAKQELDELKDR